IGKNSNGPPKGGGMTGQGVASPDRMRRIRPSLGGGHPYGTRPSQTHRRGLPERPSSGWGRLYPSVRALSEGAPPSSQAMAFSAGEHGLTQQMDRTSGNFVWWSR